MSRRALLLFFLGGSAVFVYLVARIGPGELVAEAGRTGWMFIPIFVAYGFVYVCHTFTWQLILRDEPRRMTWPRAYAMIASSFALNFLTPMLNFGGEPFKISVAGRTVGVRRAAGAALIQAVLRVLSFLLFWLTSIVMGFFLLPRTPTIVALLALGAVVLAALVAVVFSGHRRGVLEKTLNLLHRIPGMGRLATKLEPKRETLAHVDAQMADFWREHPRRFWQALGLEYLSRCVLVLEYYLILLSVGMNVGYDKAFVITGLSALMTSVLFFVPFEVGTKEGTLYLLFSLLGLPAGLGVYAAIVSRLRDMAWIGVGLLLIWVANARPAPALDGAKPT